MFTAMFLRQQNHLRGNVNMSENETERCGKRPAVSPYGNVVSLSAVVNIIMSSGRHLIGTDLSAQTDPTRTRSS